MEAGGGWPEGDGTFTGPSRPTEAFLPYYQRSRHVYGDLKIEIIDQQGKLVDTVATSKHRGVNRATWSMHLKPPTVPPAATAAYGAVIGPRVLPGTCSVKMTRGDKVYTTPVERRSRPAREVHRGRSPCAVRVGEPAGCAAQSHELGRGRHHRRARRRHGEEDDRSSRGGGHDPLQDRGH